ncbi:MAG: hypothetical protein ACT4OY_01820 [Alphaproteobacteria bacterium]
MVLEFDRKARTFGLLEPENSNYLDKKQPPEEIAKRAKKLLSQQFGPVSLPKISDVKSIDAIIADQGHETLSLQLSEYGSVGYGATGWQSHRPYWIKSENGDLAQCRFITKETAEKFQTGGCFIIDQFNGLEAESAHIRCVQKVHAI